MKTRLLNFLVVLCMVTLNAVAADKQIFQFGKASSIEEVETKTNNVMIVVPTNGTPVNIDLKDFRRWMTNGLAPTTLVTSTSNSLWANTFAFMGSTNVVTPLGMLTNNDTRAVAFDTSLTIGAGSAANSITPSAGLLSFANSIQALGEFIQGRSIIGTNFVGNGASLTNLHGSNSISAGTIDTNKMDATAYAAFMGGGDVTQSGLAAGNLIINPLNGHSPFVKTNKSPVLVILDQDATSDEGDSAGIRHALSLMDLNLLTVIAIGSTLTNEYSAAGIAAYCNYYGYSDIPIGVTKTQRYALMTGAQGAMFTMDAVATNAAYPPFSLYNSNYPAAYKVYRRALANAPDGKVVIDSEGDSVNIRQLWDSPADEISPLTGQQLCEQKVLYFFSNNGSTNLGVLEYNLNQDQYAAAVWNLITVPVVWMWWEVAERGTFAQNIQDPKIHAIDSPLYQGATNYFSKTGGSNPSRPPWDAFAKWYMAAAYGVNDGTNWVDGQPMFRVSPPIRMDYKGGGWIAISNVTWSGKPINQYYIVTNGVVENLQTNLGNAQMDRPPTRGGSPFAKGQIARLDGANFISNITVSVTGLMVDATNNRVSLGRSKTASLSPGDNTTNTLEIIGRVATATTEREAMLQLSRPAQAGVSFAQAARFSLGRWQNAAAASADTAFTIDVKGLSDTFLGTSATWGAMLGFYTGSAVWMESYFEHRFKLGSVASCAISAAGVGNNGIYFPGTTSVGLVAGGTEFLRGFGDDFYQPSTGMHFWGSGALGGSVDTGLGRNAAGVVEANSGVQGTLRDFASRTVVTTNITFHTSAQAAYVLPVANGVTMFSSNAFLYSIHNLAGVYTTNLIKAP